MTRTRLALFGALLLTTACKRGDAPASRASEPASAVGTDTSTTTPPATAQQQPVVTLSAGAPNTTYALVPGSCAANSCAAEVQLLVNAKRVDAVPLEFKASDSKLTATPGDASFTTNGAFTTYIAGEEEGAITTLVQPIRLSPQHTGLLVQQAGGFEHVKRRRDLFIIDNNRLKNVWSKQDGNGPIRSFADVIIQNGNADELVLIEGITLTPAKPDQVTATRLVWDEPSKSVRSSPIEALKAVVVGNFATAESARAKSADTCLTNYWTVSTTQLGQQSKRFALALLTADSAAATYAASNGSCPSKDARHLADFRPMNDNQR